ncbi:ABC transporter permease [Brachybacterium sp. EF45031]|uniref:ABC transporter permease n=1 Tax=Brachybacterium sillae TaxID=2810536 RepID=UPI00217EEAA8|nr:ABC transporter permease [Brachybacterium sillae]MCS6711067.1 ABC transporter permease [Brachybacterium sillae]
MSGPGSAERTESERTSSVNAALARIARDIGRADLPVVLLALLFAFLIGSVLILIADTDVRAAAAYFFARPGDTFSAMGTAIVEAYTAMFRGAILDPWANSPQRMIKPLTETLTVATPLIIAAAGMAVAFRAGLFNIGGTGQLIVGAMVAGFVGFTWQLPVVVHLLVAMVAGIIGGALWGGLAGFLKARFGANEVISTIMLNWIALYGLQYLLTTTAFNGGRPQPTSLAVKETARLPLLLGPQFRLHLGLLVAVLAIVFLWWLMSRSTLGFRFRAVGSNPRAAEVAGIDVGRSALGVMLVAGALVGLAGAVHVLGTEQRLTGGIAGNIGFDAITVALLGRSGPVGIVLAGLLFAALSTGGRFMETTAGVPLDLVQVVQALVVLFIAAPGLVRQMSGLETLRRRRDRRRAASTPGTDPSDPGTPGTGSRAVERTTA